MTQKRERTCAQNLKLKSLLCLPPEKTKLLNISYMLVMAEYL